MYIYIYIYIYIQLFKSSHISIYVKDKQLFGAGVRVPCVFADSQDGCRCVGGLRFTGRRACAHACAANGCVFPHSVGTVEILPTSTLGTGETPEEITSQSQLKTQNQHRIFQRTASQLCVALFVHATRRKFRSWFRVWSQFGVAFRSVVSSVALKWVS